MSALRPAAVLLSLAPLGLLPSCGESSPSPRETIEVRANTFTYNTQNDANLAIDSRGRVFTTWASRRQEFKSYGIFAQLFDPLGRPLTHELRVNEYVPNNQREPYAVFGPEDTAWVVWKSAEPGTRENGVFLRRFRDGADGFAPLEGALPVEVAPFATLSDPAIAVSPTGAALVGWVRHEPGVRAVEARLLDADGRPSGASFRLGQEAEVYESVPDLAPLPGGAYLAVWTRTDREGHPRGVLARRVAADGALGAVFDVSERDGAQHVEPSLDVDARGRVVVAWMSTAGDEEYHVRARRFDAGGAPLGSSFRVDAAARGHESGASVACSPDGRFVVAYNDTTAKLENPGGRPRNQVDVRARFFDAEGEPVGAERQVNLEGTGPHVLWAGENGRRVAWSGLDQVGFTWWGQIGDDAKGAGLTLLVPADLDAPAPAPFERMAVLDDWTHAEMTEARAKPDPLPASIRDLPRTPSRAGAPGGFVVHDATGWDPPDPDIAVGPNHIVTQVNQEIAWFTKDGVEQHRQNNANAGGFWAALGAEDFVFDPISVFDTHSQRFIVANSELASDGDYLDIAVSKTADPNDGWWKYRHKVSPTCGFPDFPNLGVDEDAIYITTDCFSGGGNSVFIYDKSIVTNGLPLAAPRRVQASSGLISNGNTNNYDVGSPAHYTVSASSGSSTALRIYAVTDPLGTPAVTSTLVTVPFFSSPPSAPQMGSSNRLATIDRRVKNGVVRNGRLYASHGINPGSGRAQARWYEFDLRGWPASGQSPVLLQSGDLNVGEGVYTWFPDIGVDAAGNITLAYCRSASSELPSIGYAVHLAGSPPGSIQRIGTLQTSTQPYGGGRWGDYSGLDEDPARPGTFWSHQEYSEGPWMTWAGQWTLAPAAAVVRNGSGVNPVVLTASGPPLLGTTFQAGIDASGQPGATLAIVQSWSGPATGPVLAFGEVLVDLSQPPLATSTAAVVAGASSHSFVLPPDAFLAGLTVSLQGGIVGSSLQLTNAIDATLNF